jgi:hypothetical protein
MSTFPADRGWSFVGFEQLLNGLDFLRMLAASRLSVAGSSGGKASLHLAEKEILDQKVNCGERSEDYGNNDGAPEQGLAPAHRSSRLHDTGSGQPRRELTVADLVALDKILNARRHVAHLKIATAAQLLGDLGRYVLRPALCSIEGNNPDRVFVLAGE